MKCCRCRRCLRHQLSCFIFLVIQCIQVSILRIRPTKQPNEAEELEWENTKTAASYRFNGMKRRKEWEEWRKKTESYNKFSSNSKSGFLSVSSEFTFLFERIWFVLCFIRFNSSSSLSSLSRIFVASSYSTTRTLFRCYVLCMGKRNVFTTTLSKELQFCGISLSVVRSTCIRFDSLTHEMHSLEFEHTDAYI